MIAVESLNRISGQVVDAAIEVHSALGPGLLESSYQACLAHELSTRDLVVRSQLALPLVYKGVRLETGYRLDMLVDDAVIVEIKSIEKVLPIHNAQLLSYLKLSNKRVGLIINFNTVHLREGIRRLVNRL